VSSFSLEDSPGTTLRFTLSATLPSGWWQMEERTVGNSGPLLDLKGVLIDLIC
jgi:hypothetical protein